MDDTPASDDTSRPPSSPPTSGEQAAGEDASRPPAQFNPFPFGPPTADSPVAAAFPEIFPAPAPVANPWAPPAAAPYPEPGQPPLATPPLATPPWATMPPTMPLAPGESPTFHGYYPGQAPSYPGQPPSGYPPGQPPPGYGQQPVPGYPPSYPPAFASPYSGPQTAGNGKAVAGLVLGILSLGLFFLTALDVPLIVLGIVFSVLGLRAAKRGEGRRTMALAGLICSLVAVVVVIVSLTYVVARGHTCERRFDRGSSEFNNCLLHLN